MMFCTCSRNGLNAVALQNDVGAAKDLREQISGLQYKLETAQTAASQLAKLDDNGAAGGDARGTTLEDSLALQ